MSPKKDEKTAAPSATGRKAGGARAKRNPQPVAPEETKKTLLRKNKGQTTEDKEGKKRTREGKEEEKRTIEGKEEEKKKSETRKKAPAARASAKAAAKAKSNPASKRTRARPEPATGAAATTTSPLDGLFESDLESGAEGREKKKRKTATKKKAGDEKQAEAREVEEKKPSEAVAREERQERIEPSPRTVVTTPPMPPGGGEGPDLAVWTDRERVLGEFAARPKIEPTPVARGRRTAAGRSLPQAPAAARELAAEAPAGGRRIAFVLHMHLPWVLGHGTWPHGEDWLAEAIVHCYLPNLDAFRRLADSGRRHLATVSVTPVVGAMLADPRTPAVVDRYLAERTKAAWESRRRHPLAHWWHGEYERLATIWASFDKNLIAALADLADREAIELSTSAGTHVYLPLAHTTKLVRLALRAGRELHRELFGSDPRGCWMPECAYRPGGPWRHPVSGASEERRAGNEEFLEEQGLAWTVLDSHLLRAGDPAFPYGSDLAPEEVVEPGGPHPQPYWIRRSAVAAFLRDARSAAQVWSSHGGYPGDGAYLDFHKRHWPSGLRLWRVTASQVDMLDKLVYWPDDARARAHEQAEHFVSLVAGLEGMDGGVACAPFDMELFGHWWFEGPIWLERVLELARPGAAVATTTPARELAATPALRRAYFEEGSWGAGGDHRVWVNPDTEWFWRELQELERQSFAAVRWGGSRKWRRAILNQLLLAAASDWPFLVTMGTGRDYAEMRFREHVERTRALIALGPGARALPDWVDLDLPFPEIEAEWSWPPEE